MSTPAIVRYEKHKHAAEKAKAHYLVMASIHGENHTRAKKAHSAYMRQLNAMHRFGIRAPVHGEGAALTEE